MKKRIFLVLLLLAAQLSTFIFHNPFATLHAQGWPSDYGGVMLQGFYWDSYDDTKWTNLEAQADDLAGTFDLVWLPQSGNCGGKSMGYDDLYWFTNYSSSFGTEAQLRSLISTFKAKGIKTIADVVINHRKTSNGWFGFPSETYKGVTYSMTSKDVCSNDDNGKAQTEATRLGVELGSADTGEGWDGMRDLDHRSENVQNIVKAYARFLIEDLGYAGFRYDMVKGYSASYTAMYNTYARPQFSVGEYWDSNANIKNWIRATQDEDGKPTSAAFDFQFRYNVRDAINKGSWAYLKSDNRLIADNAMKPYAVTFVENHDMEYRSAKEPQDPIKKDTLQANAFLLAMPGTPCVFLKHWQAYKNEIKLMIEVRKLAGITNTSSYSTKTFLTNFYAAEVTGHFANLYVVVGNAGSVTSDTPAVEGDFQEVVSGPGYRYLLERREGFDHAWLDKASGTYDGEVDVRAIALTKQADARLVYTTDGSVPTSDSPTIASGEALHLTQSCTLTLGLIVGGKVVDTMSRTYEVIPFIPHTATIYCRPLATLASSWPTMNFYLWTGGSTALNGSWPGRQITETEEVGGQTWYKQTVDIPSSRYSVNAVFSTGSGSPQTIDVTGITDNAFFVIKNTKNAEGKYDVTDVTATYLPYLETGIEDVVSTGADWHDAPIYDLMGRRVTKPLSGHVYLRGGHKYIRK